MDTRTVLWRRGDRRRFDRCTCFAVCPANRNRSGQHRTRQHRRRGSTGPNGPEAGVWVIAETTDLPTRLIKSVVTDDQGRYLIQNCRKRATRFSRGVMD